MIVCRNCDPSDAAYRRVAPMTSDAARAADDLAVDVGASEIAVEGFAARETYQRVVRTPSGAPSTTGPSA